ncbi:MAG: dihydrolipoyl dehydrogenase [Mycoplasmoidaceae bacterium]
MIQEENHYDLIIIGGGPGGYVAAEHAGKHNLKTLVIEKEALGGVCLNKGCIPTKTLLKSAKVLHYLKDAKHYGINIEGKNEFSLDWKAMQSNKREVVDKLVSGVKFIIKSSKAKLIEGNATMVSDHVVEVNGEKYYGEKIILATGSLPRELKLPGFKEGKEIGVVIDSTDALELKEIPKKLTVIGGGVIGIEFALLYSELGCEVTILQGLDRILEVLDDEISKTMTDILIKKGIKIITNVKIEYLNGNKLYYELDGKKVEQIVEKVLVSVGRVPRYDAFKKIDLVYDERNRIVVNKNLQTSKGHIYAIGDLTQKLMLAHVAYKHAMIAVDHILGRDIPYLLVESPSVIYTYPEVASIGIIERDMNPNECFVTKMPMSHLGKALADHETDGFIKMILDRKTGRIFGCHIIASTASDLISEIAVAMQSEATIFDLAATIHPHPSISEIIYEVAKKAIYENYK